MGKEEWNQELAISMLVMAAIAVCAIGLIAFAAGPADDEAAPIFGIKIPPGYRDWKLISVAHEAGNNNDLRAVLGNDIAIKAYREGTLPLPNGAIIARLAWSYVPSEENNKVFGREQSFVTGAPTNVQFMVKDSKKYAETGGGDSLNSRTANLTPRRTSIPVSLAMCLLKRQGSVDYPFYAYRPLKPVTKTGNIFFFLTAFH